MLDPTILTVTIVEGDPPRPVLAGRGIVHISVKAPGVGIMCEGECFTFGWHSVASCALTVMIFAKTIGTISLMCCRPRTGELKSCS